MFCKLLHKVWETILCDWPTEQFSARATRRGLKRSRDEVSNKYRQLTEGQIRRKLHRTKFSKGSLLREVSLCPLRKKALKAWNKSCCTNVVEVEECFITSFCFATFCPSLFQSRNLGVWNEELFSQNMPFILDLSMPTHFTSFFKQISLAGFIITGCLACILDQECFWQNERYDKWTLSRHVAFRAKVLDMCTKRQKCVVIWSKHVNLIWKKTLEGLVKIVFHMFYGPSKCHEFFYATKNWKTASTTACFSCFCSVQWCWSTNKQSFCLWNVQDFMSYFCAGVVGLHCGGSGTCVHGHEAMATSGGTRCYPVFFHLRHSGRSRKLINSLPISLWQPTKFENENRGIFYTCLIEFVWIK